MKIIIGQIYQRMNEAADQDEFFYWFGVRAGCSPTGSSVVDLMLPQVRNGYRVGLRLRSLYGTDAN